ncbi:hypothetical protein K3495_g4128 [Podosphaera aphanis]|nr:hypothetical protein K3495_g4128 [Podosphaera aphanis]
MQRPRQTQLAREPKLDDPGATNASRTRATALQDANIELARNDAEVRVEGEQCGANRIDADVAAGCGAGDDAGPFEPDLERGLAESAEEAESVEEPADAATARCWEMARHHLAGAAATRAPAREEPGGVAETGAGVGDLDNRAIGDGIEEAQERDFVGREARLGRGRGADLGDVDGSAG